MKIYLLQAISPVHRELETGYPSLGLACIAAYLLVRIPNIEIIIRAQSAAKNVIKERPDILGISSVTQNFSIASFIAKEVSSKLKIPVIGGGVHISCLPSSLPQGMMAAVLREGEETFFELIKSFLERGKISPSQLKNINGLCYWDDNGAIQINPSRPSIKDLDELPLPARQFLPRGSQIMFTSRGCPYKCKFCSSSAFWETIRFFSPQRVVDEIKDIISKDPGTKNLLINDDLFTSKISRVKEIAYLLEQEGLSKRIGFWICSTVNFINDEICESLVRMNVGGISFGFETGNNELLQWLKGKHVSVDQNRRAIACCNEYGLDSHGSFMLGMPDETEEQMCDTLDFIKNEHFSKGDIILCTPLPGTIFWNFAKNRGLVSESMNNWSNLSMRSSSWFPDGDDFILLTDKVPRSAFKKIYKECVLELSRRNKVYVEKRAIKYVSKMTIGNLVNSNNVARALRNPYRAVIYFKELIKAKLRIN